MMAAANQRRLDDVDEVVVLVTEGQFGQVVVVHNGMGIGPRGGQMAMLGPRYIHTIGQICLRQQSKH